MPSAGVRVTGINEIRAAINTAAKRMEAEDIDKALLAGASVVEGEAKIRCPVNVGRLRDSIRAEITSDGDNHKAQVGTVVEYSPYVEYGTGIFAENGNGRKTPWGWEGEGPNWSGFHFTRGSHPHPFMRPALDAKRKEAIQVIKDFIREKYGAN